MSSWHHKNNSWHAGIEATLQLLIERTRPTTCAASTVDGVQILQNGDKVYCDQRWTVKHTYLLLIIV